jgi:hypothetical protein
VSELQGGQDLSCPERINTALYGKGQEIKRGVTTRLPYLHTVFSMNVVRGLWGLSYTANKSGATPQLNLERSPPTTSIHQRRTGRTYYYLIFIMKYICDITTNQSNDLVPVFKTTRYEAQILFDYLRKFKNSQYYQSIEDKNERGTIESAVDGMRKVLGAYLRKKPTVRALKQE